MNCMLPCMWHMSVCRISCCSGQTLREGLLGLVGTGALLQEVLCHGSHYCSHCSSCKAQCDGILCELNSQS
jgi:hypothetical protein